MIDLSDSLLSEERRYKPHPAVLSRMTNLNEGDSRTLGADLDSISLSLTEVGGRRWDPFLAHIEVPASAEQTANHTPEEIAHLNQTALSVTDALIAHGFGGGSMSLGWALREVTTSCRCVPVLVVAHSSQSVSKYLLGLERDYRNFTIETFDNDYQLASLVETWLRFNEETIDEGPSVREAIDVQWSLAAELILRELRAATDEKRATLRRIVPISGRGLEEVLSLVTPLGDMSSTITARIMAVLGIDLVRQNVISDAQELLNEYELRAWRDWSRGKNADFTWRVLSGAVETRRRTVIARERINFGHIDSWTMFAQRWINRA